MGNSRNLNKEDVDNIIPVIIQLLKIIKSGSMLFIKLLNVNVNYLMVSHTSHLYQILQFVLTFDIGKSRLFNFMQPTSRSILNGYKPILACPIFWISILERSDEQYEAYSLQPVYYIDNMHTLHI